MPPPVLRFTPPSPPVEEPSEIALPALQCCWWWRTLPSSRTPPPYIISCLLSLGARFFLSIQEFKVFCLSRFRPSGAVALEKLFFDFKALVAVKSLEVLLKAFFFCLHAIESACVVSLNACICSCSSWIFFF